MPGRYDCVLFDLDGTLSDSIDLILAAYRHTMLVHLGHELPDERWLKGIGIPLEIQLAEFARTPEEATAMRATYAEYYIERHDEQSTMFPGAIEAVTALLSQGISIGLVTSKSRVGVNRTLRLHQLEDFFDGIVSADDTAKGKPAPDPVLSALDQLNQPPERAAFVGDSPHDLQAGRAAGVATIAVNWGPYPREDLEACQPTEWLQHPDDIATLGREETEE